jgi:hypothetical protein
MLDIIASEQKRVIATYGTLHTFAKQWEKKNKAADLLADP